MFRIQKLDRLIGFHWNIRRSSSFKDFVDKLQKSKPQTVARVPGNANKGTGPVASASNTGPTTPGISSNSSSSSSSSAFRNVLANLAKNPGSASPSTAKPANSANSNTPPPVKVNLDETKPVSSLSAGLQRFKVSVAEHQKLAKPAIAPPAINPSPLTVKKPASDVTSKFGFSSVNPTFSSRTLGGGASSSTGDDAAGSSSPLQNMKFSEFIKRRANEQINIDASKLSAKGNRMTSVNAVLGVDMANVSKAYNDRLRGRSREVKLKGAQRIKTVVKVVPIPAEGLSVRELASRLSMKIELLSKKLEALGQESGSFDRIIDADFAELTVLELGYNVKRLASKEVDIVGIGKKGRPVESEYSVHPLKPRAPVVCIMGHVDHGKTTLLDSLRKANIAATEAGGITQKLSAFTVPIRGKEVVFLDTPGHQAFSSMRVNGAQATDVAVLVIAMDDGVRPQTIEALNTAKESACHILVALNKIDRIPVGERPAAKARILNQLVPLGVVCEEYGGDTPVVEVAGKTGEGLENLLDILSLQTDILELKAPTAGPAEATVLDSNVEKGRGVVADILVRWGSLMVGDYVVVGTSYGKVKSLISDRGKVLKACPPSTPVRMLGLRTVPTAGQELLVVPSEARAKEITERRTRVQELRQQLRGGETTTEKDKDGNSVKAELGVQAHISVVLKADGVGTLQALNNVVGAIKEKCSNVDVNIVVSGIGDVTQSDIDRAAVVTSTAATTCVLAFNVNASDSLRQAAKEMDVRICKESIIYRLEDELLAVMTSLMPKERFTVEEGTARVLQLFPLNDKSGVVIAGIEVKSGRFRTSGSHGQFVYRIIRGSEVIQDDLEADQLKRFKDVVHEVEQGNECGLKLKSFYGFMVGDIIECRKIEWRPRALKMNRVELLAELAAKPVVQEEKPVPLTPAERAANAAAALAKHSLLAPVLASKQLAALSKAEAEAGEVADDVDESENADSEQGDGDPLNDDENFEHDHQNDDDLDEYYDTEPRPEATVHRFRAAKPAKSKQKPFRKPRKKRRH